MRRFIGTRVRRLPPGVVSAGGGGARRGMVGRKARHRWSINALRRDTVFGPVLRSGVRSANGGLKRFMPVRAHWAVPETEPCGAKRGFSTEEVPWLSLVSEGVQGEAEVTE